MTLEELEAAIGLLTDRVTSLEAATPTLEEQLFSTVITSWNGATTFNSGPRMTLMVAPWPVRVLSVNLSIEYTTLASGQPAVVSSNTNYWRLTLERGLPSGSFPDIASKTTQSTGAEAGGAIYTRRDWSFDSANWSGDRDLDKGDLLCLVWGDTGNPTTVRLPMTATVRYAAL